MTSPPSTPPAEPPPEPTPADSAAGGARDSVLVVDDDPNLRALLRMALEQAGYGVVEAGGGLAALELLDRQPFALVLLDHQMPDLDGLRVLEHVRSRQELDTVPVILLTAAGEMSDRLAGFSAGADDYITKPFSVQEVLARVGAHVRARRAWQETLAAHQRQRAALFRALAVAGNRDTPEETAQALCNALVGHSGVGSAAVVSFTPEGLALPLAVAGPPLWGLEAGDATSSAVRDYLAGRSATGPWMELDGAAAGSAPRPPIQASGQVAGAPIGPAGAPEGVLLLAVEREPGDSPTVVLSAAVDFAGVAGELLRWQLSGAGAGPGRSDVREVVRTCAFGPVFQPIVHLPDGSLQGMEALTRFDDGSNPEARFREAARAGVGLELELATLRRALAAAAATPQGTWVSVNVSPGLILAGGDLGRALEASPRPVVLELSEHEAVSDYDALAAAVAGLDGDVRLCVDDAGAGFASLRHILHLGPAFVKLDRSWVHGVDADPARQALVAGLRHFARHTGAELIAEGVERDVERAALIELGVAYGQGRLLGEPAPLPA